MILSIGDVMNWRIDGNDVAIKLIMVKGRKYVFRRTDGGYFDYIFYDNELRENLRDGVYYDDAPAQEAQK